MVRGVPKPDSGMLAKFGIKENMQALFVDETDTSQSVFPENWLPLNVFLDLQTQWRVGMKGPLGLDYQAVKAALELMQIAVKEWPDLFQDIRILEAAWLDEAAQLRKEQGE